MRHMQIMRGGSVLNARLSNMSEQALQNCSTEHRSLARRSQDQPTLHAAGCSVNSLHGAGGSAVAHRPHCGSGRLITVRPLTPRLLKKSAAITCAPRAKHSWRAPRGCVTLACPRSAWGGKVSAVLHGLCVAAMR